MDKGKITKRQKKILVIVGVVGSAFIIFIAFIYIPMRAELARLKDEFYKLEAEISQIKKLAKEGESLEEAIVSLKDRLDAINKKFPEKDEVILRELSGLAAELGIEVVSIRPQKKKVIQEIGSRPIGIKECLVQEMPVSMTLRASYRALGEFFKILKEDFPIFVRVDNVRIVRAGDKQTGVLDAELNLDTYLICPGMK